MRIVIDMIRFWGRAAPNRPAVIQPEMVTTYEGLAAAIESISERISRLNLDRREPVAVSLANPSFALATMFALLRAGYSVASINRALYPHMQGAKLRNLIYDTEGQMLSGGRNIRFDMSWLPVANQPPSPQAQRNHPDTKADTIFFTSGTTGLPKKIVQAASAVDRFVRYPFTCATGPYHKVLIMPGLASTFGFNRTCELFSAGKTACFALNSESALALISLFGIDLVIASPSQALSLAETRNSSSFDVDSLKGVLVGGGKLGPEGVSKIRSSLCRNLLSQYGSTEAGVVALATFESIENIPGAVGYVLPWTEIEIVDEAGQVLPAGAEGIVRYRTPQLLENIAAAGTAGVPGVRDGWFYPGDVGSLTSNGALCLAGRMSDVINRGGVKISAARIEEILQALPNVKEAAACGVAGPSGMEELWIAVVPSGPVDVAVIKQHLEGHGDIKIAPDEVYLMNELPRGDLGKVQKYRLREQMANLKRGG